MNWKKIALGSTLAGTLMLTGLSGQALAYWGCYTAGQTAVSATDQAKIDEIRQKYDADLTSLEAKLRTTSRDLDQALIDQDLYDLEREYYTVRDRAWGEMAEAGVTGNWGHDGWNCRWHDGHDWMSRGGLTASRWSGHRGGCCW
jgi:hypothetical protein